MFSSLAIVGDKMDVAGPDSAEDAKSPRLEHDTVEGDTEDITTWQMVTSYEHPAESQLKQCHSCFSRCTT